MSYFIMALLCSIFGVAPLLIKKRFVSASILGISTTFIMCFLFWLTSASIVGPFFGPCLWIILLLWIIAAIIDSTGSSKLTWIWIFPIALFALRAIAVPVGGKIFRSHDFASLIGPMNERIWTQDIQPKNPKHIRLSNIENAIYLAKNSISKGGTIGSQFEVSKGNMTLQKVNGAFWYIVPLDFRDSYGVWSSTGVTPGYIMVSAEDDEMEPVFKTLPDNKKLKYTPNAFFDSNLERHLRMNGYLNVGLTDYTFEVDDEGNCWWVVSTYQPTIINSGEKITGVIVVNPGTGEIEPYSLAKLPSWIDRAMPKVIVENNLVWWGEYAGGWINSWWGKSNVIKPEEPILIYGADDTLEWVTGMTSKNDKDTSLVGLVYTNSRTGESVYYKTNGGSTDNAIIDAVKNNGYVKVKSLHPVDPQIYNIYGTMASIMPLLNASDARQGVAIVDVTDIQKVAIGVDMNEALNIYQDMIGSKAKAAIEKTRNLAKVSGVVDRIHSEYLPSGTIYRIHLNGIPHLFVGGKGLSRKLTVTEPKDEVSIEYYVSGEEEEPIYKFDNLSLPLDGTAAQKEVTERSVQRTDAQNDETSAKTIKEKMNNLTPQQLKELEKFVPQK